MRRIILFLVIGTLMASMAAVGALSGLAQEDDSDLFGPPLDEEEEATEEEAPAEEEPVVLCAPAWQIEWYQWWGAQGGWWYGWWYQWCYDLEDERWFREYDSWFWGPPI